MSAVWGKRRGGRGHSRRDRCDDINKRQTVWLARINGCHITSRSGSGVPEPLDHSPACSRLTAFGSVPWPLRTSRGNLRHALCSTVASRQKDKDDRLALRCPLLDDRGVGGPQAIYCILARGDLHAYGIALSRPPQSLSGTSPEVDKNLSPRWPLALRAVARVYAPRCVSIPSKLVPHTKASPGDANWRTTASISITAGSRPSDTARRGISGGRPSSADAGHQARGYNLGGSCKRRDRQQARPSPRPPLAQASPHN